MTRGSFRSDFIPSEQHGDWSTSQHLDISMLAWSDRSTCIGWCREVRDFVLLYKFYNPTISSECFCRFYGKDIYKTMTLTLGPSPISSQNYFYSTGRWTKCRGEKVDVAIKQIDPKFSASKLMDFMETCVLRCLLFGRMCVSTAPCASPPPWPSIFSNYSFLAHHPVNRDDWHLLAHAMTSDFSVAWQFLS
jgi:hypothetical protein